MFCPFCKAAYRASITRCSDCSLPLVDTIPNDDSDPNFMVLLWNGESLNFLETVCSELDKAAIPVATPRVEILLRGQADRYHLKHLKTFPYVLGVFKSDFQAARKILESAAEHFVPPITIPPENAYAEPFDERARLAYRAKTENVLDATVTVLESADVSAVEFFEASLDGLNVPFRRVCLEEGSFEVRVRPVSEGAARQVLQEIKNGTSCDASAAAREDALLSDEPPRSYFLAWFMPILWALIWIFATVAVSDNTTPLAMLLFLAGFLHWGGMFWMAHQAATFERRPFKYYVAATIPFAFVWYYVERVMARKGDQRLPIAARLRMNRPQA